MEHLKPKPSFSGRAALLATACLISSLTAGETRGGATVAEQENSRRNAAMMEAQELLQKGDEAYKAGRYGDATEAYSGARDLVPNAPITAEFRGAVTQRYSQASVEYARSLSRKGDVAGAKDVVDKVLAIAPEDSAALAYRAQLDDPIRTNPALTKEHAKNVDTVRRDLYMAEGAYNLGDFDKAKSTYNDVLRIDPTNSAARRGLERVSQAKSEYHKSSYDQARAAMLNEVESQWELKVPEPVLDAPALGDPGLPGTSDFISVKSKLDRIIIPKFALDQASLDEALDFLRLKTAENDTIDKQGVNFAVNLGPANSPEATRVRALRFDLQLANVPVSQIIKYLTDVTRTSWSTDDYSVIISPAGSASKDLVTRSYKIPPDFISTVSAAGGDAAGTTPDPFSTDKPAGGLLPKRLSAQEALANQGVVFPEGASASIVNNTLRVINTEANQEYISQIVSTFTQTEPVVVSVKVTMIRTQQTNLEELGFDWILNPFPISNSVSGSGGTRGNQPGRTGGDFISPVNGTSVDGIPADPTQLTTNGVTNGLRSGDQAINQNSIDNLINNPSRNAQSSSVAPGIMGVTGLFTDGQVQALMRGLDQKKGVDIMAQPSVVTRSGQSSSISIVREFIYATEYEPPELPNSTGNTDGDFFGGGGSSVTPVTPATPTAFDKRDVGITLEVLPVVDPGKKLVNVTLNPVFSDFSGFVNYGSPINTTSNGVLGPETVVLTENAILMPIFDTQKLSTSLDIYDGATIVIGGLKQDSIQDVEDTVPVLGSIPIIGRLFQSTSRQSVKTAVIFLVTVDLMDPTGRPLRNR